MPADPQHLYENSRPEILKQLDDFNTADMSDGIMLGILREQESEGDDQPARRGSDDGGGEERAPRQQRQAPEPKAEFDPEKYFAPLNTSIQEFGQQNNERVAELQRQIQEQNQHLAQLRQSAHQQSQQQQNQNVDYDAPVTYRQLEEIHRAHNETRNYVQQNSTRQALTIEYQRGLLELQSFKQSNPGSTLSSEEYARDFNKYAGGDPNKVAGINWGGIFQHINYLRTQPAMQAELTQLRKENEELKKGAGKRSTAAPARPVSPAVQQGGRNTIQSHMNERDENVVNLASFRKNGNFRGFGKDLLRGNFLGNSNR